MNPLLLANARRWKKFKNGVELYDKINSLQTEKV